MKDRKIYLGVDWGLVRIGLAIGDDESKTAVPIRAVSSLEDILKTVNEESIDAVIIGDPIKMSGERELSEKGDFNIFFRKLKLELNIPLILFDERLSSKAADALPGEKKQKAGRDSVAAMIILQGYFDSLPKKDIEK